jgi:hypothetical protein
MTKGLILVKFSVPVSSAKLMLRVHNDGSFFRRLPHIKIAPPKHSCPVIVERDGLIQVTLFLLA